MALRLSRSYLQALEREDENQVLADLARAPRLELVHSEPPAEAPEPPTQTPGLGWMAEGACKGLPSEWWFSDAKDTRSRDADVTRGKQVCAGCPVRVTCLDYGLTEEHGIWGGVGPRERGRMLKARGRRLA